MVHESSGIGFFLSLAFIRNNDFLAQVAKGFSILGFLFLGNIGHALVTLGAGQS
jgi:hypothetical protein